jgi:hypothetical protein
MEHLLLNVLKNMLDPQLRREIRGALVYEPRRPKKGANRDKR